MDHALKRRLRWHLAGLVPILVSGSIASAQTFDRSFNYISNGGFEVGFIDDDPGSPDFGKPIVQDWFRANNGFEDIYVGEDASTGLQSVGYDTTGTPGNQFDMSTWADWRALAIPVAGGELLQWEFSFLMPPTATGELLPEIRFFADVAQTQFIETDFAIVSHSATLPDDPDNHLYYSDGDWKTVTREYTVPANAAVVDFRFSNIFTLVTLPFEGLVRLDDVGIYRELPEFEADFDEDGDVDGDDFLRWQSGFPTLSGAAKLDGDYDNDGDVDGDDFLGWQTEFPSPGSGAGSSVATAVPEPSAAVLVLISLFVMPLRGCPRR